MLRWKTKIIAVMAAQRKHGFGGGRGFARQQQKNWQPSRAVVVAGVGSAFFGVMCGSLSFERPVVRCREMITFEQLKSVEERFAIQSHVGKGGQADVYKALDKKTKRLVAIKVTQKDHPEGHQLVFSEIGLMTRIGSHHNITSLQDACETATCWIMVMDLADGGALFDHIIKKGHLNEALASDYILQVAEGLMHMHRRGLIHGDVKSENLLLSHSDANASIKLCDFGMARPFVDGQSFEFGYKCGTFDYWAPEVVRQDPCTQAIDMWALGVVVYIMMCGSHPFDPTATASDAEILSNIAHAKIDTRNEGWTHLSPECRDLISALLCPDVSKRLTASQMLQHRWIVNQQTTDALPHVQKQRLRGFQALVQLRAAAARLNLHANDIFDAVDLSKSGALEIGELKRLFDLIGVSLSREALDAVCEIGDTDRDGKIQRGEFVQMLRLKDNEKHVSLSDADIKCMFGIFDQNHDGKIVAEELVNVFGLLGRKMTQQQAELFIKQATSGNDDALSFTAFSKLMKADSSLFEK